MRTSRRSADASLTVERRFSIWTTLTTSPTSAHLAEHKHTQGELQLGHSSNFSKLEKSSNRLEPDLRDTEVERRRAQEQLTRVQDKAAQLQGRITAMESSKCWKLRQGWFRVKRLLRLPVVE